MNEEEIRGNILLPYLSDLGINHSEISLETSFSIRLGRSKKVIKGRSDILCKRNGKNLFIIELKNDSVSIDQSDIDQGISYSRSLTDNIAPFTIISNGKQTRIFDSVSKEEITGSGISGRSEYLKNGYTLSADVDVRIRYEALRHFISFSPENLQQFCEDQVRDRMGPIVGDINSPYSKFVKELYVQRTDLQSAFNDFVKSEKSVFGIVGAAGVGKTNAMCSLALQELENKFVFFYNATIINKTPVEHIAQDMNGVFSSKSESDNILKKLDELGRFLNKSVLIFIDAIDENGYSNLGLELSEMALIVRNLERLKICISCKSSVWGNILRRNGTPSHLFEELSKFHNPIPTVNNCRGFLLKEFSDEEFFNIVRLYKSIFGFKGEISKSLLEELRNGFFLRIFSQVYSNKEVPKNVNDKELIRAYLKQSLEKTSIGVQVGLRVLSNVGKTLMNHNYTSMEAFHDEGLEVESLVEKLGFSIGETIPEDLFARNILIKSNKEDSYRVSFYYSKIRDYVISFHSYKVDQLTNDELYDLLEKFYENHIGQSAINFYIENGIHDHQMTLIKFKKDKALAYLDKYNSYLDQNFKRFKDKFDPNAEGDIGIFLPEDLLHNDGYALFPLEPGSVHKVEHLEMKGMSHPSAFFYKKKIRILHGSNMSLLVANQDEVVRRDVFKQLKEMLDKGMLHAYNSDVLLLEQVTTILFYYSKQLGYNFQLQEHDLPRFDLLYPISLPDVRSRILKFLATEYYKREGIDPKRMAEKVDQAVHENLEIPRLRIGGDYPPFEELFRIVDILLSRGYNRIVGHHLPCPDVSLIEARARYEKEKGSNKERWEARAWKIRTYQFTSAQAKLYIETFLKHFETCYKEFVEYCFPTLKDRFPFYKSFPHEYFVYMKDSDALKWGHLGYRRSKSGEVKINFQQCDFDDEPFKRGETGILLSFALDYILHNDFYHRIDTIDNIRSEKVDEFCVIRNWIYRFLKRDMEALFKEV